MTRLRIVIPTFNSADGLAAVLAAATPQAPVTVVDDASTDGTPELAAKAGATVLRVDRRSAAHARNVGWRAAADADVVLFLDSDGVPAPDWAARLAAPILGGEADIAGGDVRSRPRSAFGRAYDRMYRALDASLFAAGSIMLPAMNLAVRRDLVDTVAFDDTLPGAMCEDVDFLARAKALGARIAFVPEALVHHDHPGDLEAFLEQEWRHGRGRALFVERHPEHAGAVASWPRWFLDSTLGAPAHWLHAARAAGADPAVMALHWLRSVAGNAAYVKARR